MAQLRQNRVKHKLQRGEVATAVLGYNTEDIIDFLGPLGFDCIRIEAEHGPVDFGDIADLTRACDLWGMTSVVRLNLNLPSVISRTLDQGAQGIVVPHVNTADEARAAVDAAKFYPIGHRGFYAGRQSRGVSVADYISRINDETFIMVLIEDIEGINNLPEILTVEHIDVFQIAPSDLAQSMGHLGQSSHPDVQATIDKAIGEITSAGRVAGTPVNDSTVEAYIEKGVRFLNIGWPAWLEAGARSYLEKVSAASRRA